MRSARLSSFIVMVAFLAAAGNALAGSQLSVRLIHASNAASGGAPVPADIADVLARSLPYKHFVLKGSASLGLPASGSRKLAGYTVECSGQQGQLRISVKSAGKTLINTTVSLRDGKPFIVGGLPAAGGKEILVFVAR